MTLSDLKPGDRFRFVERNPNAVRSAIWVVEARTPDEGADIVCEYNKVKAHAGPDAVVTLVPPDEKDPKEFHG